MSPKMRAVVYDGPFKVSVREVEKPKIQHPCDVIVKSMSPVLMTVLVSMLLMAVDSHNELHLWQVGNLISSLAQSN